MENAVALNGIYNYIKNIKGATEEAQEKIRYLLKKGKEIGANYIDINSGIGYEEKVVGAKVFDPIKNDENEYTVIDENGIDYKYIKVSEVNDEAVRSILSKEIHEPAGQTLKLDAAVEAVVSYFKNPSKYYEMSDKNEAYYMFYVKAFYETKKEEVIKLEHQKQKRLVIGTERDGYTSSYLLLIIAGTLFISWGSLLVVNLVK